MTEGLVQALVGILQLDILAHDADGDLAARVTDPLDQVDPRLQLRRLLLQRDARRAPRGIEIAGPDEGVDRPPADPRP